MPLFEREARFNHAQGEANTNVHLCRKVVHCRAYGSEATEGPIEGIG